MTGVLSETVTGYPSRAHGSTRCVLVGVRVAHLFSFLCCVFFFVFMLFVVFVLFVCFLYLRSVSCAHCCLCLWIVHSWCILDCPFDFIWKM